MFWYPGDTTEAEVRFWTARPSLPAYMIAGDEIVYTTVYESPTRPCYYSLDAHRMGTFGTIFFASEIQATEHLMATLIEQQRRTNHILDALADRYNELLLVEERQEQEYELSAKHTDVGAR